MKRYTLSLIATLFTINTFAQQDTISIYYASGHYQLTTTQKKTIDSLAYRDFLISTNNYIIIGYADVVGKEQSNLKLSERRAEEMAQYLNTLGITHIETVIGKGEVDKPINNNGYPTDRRVDIVSSNIPTAKSTMPDITKLKPNDVFDLENMFFLGGTTKMLEKSLPTLEALLTFMRDNKSLKIRIEGHVHCLTYQKTGGLPRPQNRSLKDLEHYHQLSTGRAKFVRDYLIEYGIDSNRLRYIGLSCDEMNLHPKNNRRVSIRILSNDKTTTSKVKNNKRGWQFFFTKKTLLAKGSNETFAQMVAYLKAHPNTKLSFSSYFYGEDEHALTAMDRSEYIKWRISETKGVMYKAKGSIAYGTHPDSLVKPPAYYRRVDVKIVP